VYYEFLRDGKKPKHSLSKSAKFVDDYVKREIKKISGEELMSLQYKGKNYKSIK
jgi:hypothetical protein